MRPNSSRSSATATALDTKQQRQIVGKKIQQSPPRQAVDRLQQK